MSKKRFSIGTPMSLHEAAALIGISADLLAIWVSTFDPSDDTEEPVLYPDDVARYRLLVGKMREKGYAMVSRVALEDMQQNFNTIRDSSLDTLYKVRDYLVAIQQEVQS
jgi:hypothetical protein